MKLVIASLNEGKTGELRRMLGGGFDEVFSLNDLGMKQMPEENGATFAENAEIKARAVRNYTESLAGSRFSGATVLADDSGLCVDALGGAPGVFSARYGGHDDKTCRERLLSELGDNPTAKQNSSARCA